MGWFDNIFNSEKKREQERKRAEFEAKQAEVIARCYRSEEELAQINLLIHDQDDMQKFEDWVEEKRENLPYNTYPIAVLQSLRDDIKAEDVPFLKDRERLVLEGILKRLNSENLTISDLEEIGKILNSKTVYDQQLFPLIKKHYDITNLPNEEYRYRYLEAAGYTKEEARQSFSIYSRGLISAYNSPKTLEAFPNAKTQIENYLINTADDPYSSYALRGEVRRIIADCPELQNNQTAQLCEQKFAQHDKDISQHTVKIYDLYELDAYIKLLSLNSISPEFKEDIHLSINAAVANLFAKNPDQPFHNVLDTLNSYAENYPEHFLALPEPLLHDYVNQADKRDISFYHIENGENVGDYQKPDGTFVNTYYSSDVSYHTLRLLLDKGYGSEEARAARLERIAKIDEAYPTAIDYYKEKYGQYIGHEQRQTAEEKQETLDNVPSPTVLHDEFVGNYLRKEALNNENGEIIGTRFYLAEDGSEYVELIGDENNPKQKITFIEADSHMLFSKEEYDFEAKTTTSVRYDNGKPLYVEIKNDQNVQIQTEHYKNGNLWERYRSTDDKNSAYGPNHIFEAYTEEGVLESVARFDDKNAVADVTYYESDGKTVSKVEYKNENGKPARIELYSEGKLADVTVFDEEGNPHSESQEKENVLLPDVSEQNLDDKANEAAIDPAQAVSKTIENQSENEETQPMESPIEIQTETADEKQENTEMPETSANEDLGERNQGIAAILGGLAENARIQEELEAQSRPAPAEPVDTQPQTETSETTQVENNVTFVPYSMEEREAYIKDGLEQYEQKLDQNGFPKKGRKTKLESQKRNLT